ncbi:MAG: FAD-dependent oxidoreductase [Spirochaetales bacterium]|nr:FAD-dependent oxidoreductase [Spirochaetales bacterium]
MKSGIKSFLSPFSTLKNIFKKPVTIQYPAKDLDVFSKKGSAPTYRGLHTNDLLTCIGCGTCADICPTTAITMVDGENTGPGKLGKIPRIDYGRCCFCAFCVDMCTSSSLNMSRDYIHTVENPPAMTADKVTDYKYNDFRITPDNQHNENIGFTTPDELSWLDRERAHMELEEPGDRKNSFMEIVKGFSKAEAIKEASRCVECGVCTETCPAHMEIPGYIRAIWEGDFKKAVGIIYHTNPLPHVCGRICTHKCETVCSISLRGEPVAIRWLKRFAVDSLPDDQFKDIFPEVKEKKTKKIAVVGGGPGGLSCAYYLALSGYPVTIFEEKSEAGGMARIGAPAYRMPDAAVKRDVDKIKDLGVEIKTNISIGKDIPLEALHKEFDAVFLSTGLHLGRDLGFEAEKKTKDVYQAIELLTANRLGEKIPVGEHIVVIGGGNVAFDIARTLQRLQIGKFGKVSVTLVCVEERDKMLADKEEIEESAEEGVAIIPGYGPVDIDMSGNRVTSVRFAKVISLFDENGRFNPRYDSQNIKTVSADMVVESIGQRADLGYIPAEIFERIEWTPRKQFKVNDYGQTSVGWLFAGGDIARGPDIIHAITDGHNAAKGIDLFLEEI